MSGVLNIEELRKMAMPVIEIPDFENKGTIKVRVEKPKLYKLASEGKIPNFLMAIATEVMTGKPASKPKNDTEYLKSVAGLLELFCKNALVEPTYEEFKDIMTDQQKDAIFSWAMEGAEEIENFREEETDGRLNNDVGQIPKEAK